MNKTKIDWCDMSWNPVTGCLHDCEYCYARKIANRFGSNEDRQGVTTVELHYKRDNPYPYNFYPTFHKYRLEEPSKKKKGQIIFVGSMTDLFGEWVPDEWINEVFKACEKAPQHRYLFLTKNVERYSQLDLPQSKNMFFGTTITKEDEMSKFNYLPAFSCNFVSIEPILEDLKAFEHNILFKQVDWVIVGAESGNRKDKVIPQKQWIIDIKNHCKDANVPLFMKESLRELMAEDFIQEYPW